MSRHRLYVRNISTKIYPKDVELLFRDYGKLLSFSIVETRHNTNCCVVEYKHSKDAKNAIYKLDGHKFYGRQLFIEYEYKDNKCKSKKRRKDHKLKYSHKRQSRRKRHNKYRSYSRSPSNNNYQRSRSRSRPRSLSQSPSFDSKSITPKLNNNTPQTTAYIPTPTYPPLPPPMIPTIPTTTTTTTTTLPPSFLTPPAPISISDTSFTDTNNEEDSTPRLNIKEMYDNAMKSGTIVKCRLIRRRFYNENDDGDAHFRICESQYIRSGGRMLDINYNEMKETLNEITYVINPRLINKFEEKKKEMITRIGEDNVNIILAWHGTSQSNISSIIENNFDLSKLSSHSGDKGWYGAGIYFSEFANVSQSYGNGLLLCKIMLGNSFKMIQTETGCEKKKGYDSHMRANGRYGSEIVIFDVDQILPCYMVKY